MNREKIDMSNPDLRRNPFKAPEGYFGSLNDRIRERITEEESASSAKPKGVYFYFRSAFNMAASLLLLFGLGYGIMSVTSFFDKGHESDTDKIVYIEEGLLRSSFVDFMYDDIDYRQEDIQFDSETFADLNENITLLLKNLSEEDLIDYYLALSDTK